MRHLLIVVLCVLFFASAPVPATADDPAGVVKTVKGTASVVQGQKSIPATGGQKVFKGDTLKTGQDGSLGIVFEDDTLLSLGPNSEVVVDQYVFAPAQGNMSIVTRMMKGTASYVSGIIAKLSPQSVKFETPTVTLGVRGTRFCAQVEEK